MPKTHLCPICSSENVYPLADSLSSLDEDGPVPEDVIVCQDCGNIYNEENTVSKHEDGMAAFPVHSMWHTKGMTLRDYFAGQALASVNWWVSTDIRSIAVDCYYMADKMLEARCEK